MISRLRLLPTIVTHFGWCTFAAMLMLVVAGNAAADPLTIVYDTEAYPLEPSSVSECPYLGPCFSFPIVGRISIKLDPIAPVLANVDSSILVPPDVTPAYSAEVWQYLDSLFVGEYTSDALFDASSADVSMRFFVHPAIDVPFPPYEFYVDLTEGRNRLHLTGGYLGVAAVDIPNSVAFDVNGRAVPEPATFALVGTAVVALIANRRRR